MTPDPAGVHIMNAYDIEPAILAETNSWSGSTHCESDIAEQPGTGSAIGFGSMSAELTGANLKTLSIGLVNFYRFTEECLTKAFDGLHSETAISSFPTVKECTAEAGSDLDLIIYYLHGNELSDTSVAQVISPICQTFPGIPLIVFSDAEPVQQPRIMRAAMKS